MKRSVKIDLSWRVWSLIVGFFILLSFIGLSLAVDPAIHGHPDQVLAPVGSIMAFNLTSCPVGWIAADGTSGTPDLRGVFVRGLNGDVNGRDVARALGSYQSDDLKNHVHNIKVYGDGTSNSVKRGNSALKGTATSESSGGNPGTETRPKNVALLYCMKV